MKRKMLCAAIAAAMTCAPAYATIWQFGISVPATGTASTLFCGSETDCDHVWHDTELREVLTRTIEVPAFTTSVEQHEAFYVDFFHRGDAFSAYSLTLEWLPDGRGIVGRNFDYFGDSRSHCTVSCAPETLTSLHADTFNVTFLSAYGGPAPVPEASTWAMMLVGFAAVGFAMRRRRAPRSLTPFGTDGPSLSLTN